MKYWARFWTGFYEDEGCQKPPFPIWITDHKERSEDTDRDDCSVCGVLNADSKDDALHQISNYFPDFTLRCVTTVDDNYQPGPF